MEDRTSSTTEETIMVVRLEQLAEYLHPQDQESDLTPGDKGSHRDYMVTDEEFAVTEDRAIQWFHMNYMVACEEDLKITAYRRLKHPRTLEKRHASSCVTTSAG